MLRVSYSTLQTASLTFLLSASNTQPTVQAASIRGSIGSGKKRRYGSLCIFFSFSVHITASAVRTKNFSAREIRDLSPQKCRNRVQIRPFWETIYAQARMCVPPVIARDGTSPRGAKVRGDVSSAARLYRVALFTITTLTTAKTAARRRKKSSVVARSFLLVIRDRRFIRARKRIACRYATMNCYITNLRGSTRGWFFFWNEVIYDSCDIDFCALHWTSREALINCVINAPILQAFCLSRRWICNTRDTSNFSLTVESRETRQWSSKISQLSHLNFQRFTRCKLLFPFFFQKINTFLLEREREVI